MKRISDVQAQEGFILKVTWSDGTSDLIDLSGLVAISRHFNVFAKDPAAFARVAPINWGHGVGWENGLDYSGENLARIAAEQRNDGGSKVLEQFRRKYGLTNRQVARALGYGESTIKNIQSGRGKMTTAARIAIKAMMDDPALLYGRMSGSTVRSKRPSHGITRLPSV